jgi:hypothetical protein
VATAGSSPITAIVRGERAVRTGACEAASWAPIARGQPERERRRGLDQRLKLPPSELEQLGVADRPHRRRPGVLLEQRELAQHLPAPQRSDQRLRGALVEDRQAAAANDEHAVRRLAGAEHPLSGADVDLADLLGEPLAQLGGESGEHRNAEEEIRGFHQTGVSPGWLRRSAYIRSVP